MRVDCDAAIIGGGVIGSSIAYHMAKRGKKVILLERERLAGQASSAAAGMLAAQAEMNEAGPLFELARRSRAMFPELAEDLKQLCGIDIGLVQKGMFKIALTSEEETELHRIIDFQCAAGEKAEWMSGEEVRRHEIEVSGDVRGAMFIPDDGQVSAPDLSLAFAKSAASLGAQIREFTEVKSLILEKGNVAGVMTQEDTIYCDRVVVASGFWSGRLLEQAGCKTPIYPVKGECFSVISEVPLIRSTIFSHGCYLVPKKGGRTLIGATMKEHSYDRKVTLEGIATLLERAKRLVPGIVHAEWEKAWAGLRPQTPDGLPYLGEHSKWKGLFIAAGHYRNGILLSPITGKLAADWAEGKEDGKLPMKAFAVERHSDDPIVKAGVK
jgi:glycine oxidase